MADSSKIEWTDATWNPIAGCSPVSPGCTHCYAATMARRLEAMGQEKYADTAFGPIAERRGKLDVFTGELRFDEDALETPLKWKRPRRIFVSSMSDLFHESIALDWPDRIDQVFDVMARCPQHTFQVLTKRPELMCRFVNRWLSKQAGNESPPGAVKPLSNVWLGTSVEDQQRADERIPWLLRTSAAVRFLSCEPLLGAIRLGSPGNGGLPVFEEAETVTDHCGATGRVLRVRKGRGWVRHSTTSPQIDWVIAGGESGPRSRPMHPHWVRSLRDQCQAARVPFFFKQWGEWLPVDEWSGRRGHRYIPIEGDVADATAVCVERVGKKQAGRTLDGREWSEFPRAGTYHGDTGARRG